MSVPRGLPRERLGRGASHPVMPSSPVARRLDDGTSGSGGGDRAQACLSAPREEGVGLPEMTGVCLAQEEGSRLSLQVGSVNRRKQRSSQCLCDKSHTEALLIRQVLSKAHNGAMYSRT